MKTKYLIQKIFELRKSGCNIFIVALRFLYYYWFFDKKIFAHQKVIIKDVRNIMMSKKSVLIVGLCYRGFVTRYDRTLINVQGTLYVNGKVQIACGARIDVCKGGILELKNGVIINSFTKIICANKIIIKEGTGIGWDCQIMDTDFHEISAGEIKLKKESPIIIGKNVLIACKVCIYKGVKIADGVVISANCVIIKSIETPGVLVSMEIPIKQSTVQFRWKP